MQKYFLYKHYILVTVKKNEPVFLLSLYVIVLLNVNNTV